MTFSFIEIMTDALNSLGNVISYFTTIRTYLTGVMNDVNAFNFTSYVTPYLATVKYVTGSTMYNMTFGVIQLSLFIGLSKAMYEIVHIIKNSGLVQKPIAIIKNLLNI